MSGSDWFFALGVLVIGVALVWWGVIVWRERRAALGVRYERDIPEIDVDDIDLLRGELPSGGARIVGGAAVGDEAREGGGAVDLAEPVPVLMDPIDQDVERAAAPAAAVPAKDVEVAEPARSEPPAAEPPAEAEADAPSEPASPPAPPASDEMEQTPLFAGEPIVARDGGARGGARGGRRRGGREEPDRSVDEEVGDESAAGSRSPGPPEDVIVIRVLCRAGAHADGPTLVETITDHGLRFGDMNIFHRHSPTDRARIDFSVASAVEPGTFDLGAIDDFTTPGVTMFMQLPGPDNPLEAFEDMVSIARGIATAVGADLKDEQHSVMTAQTIEHCRQRIRDFTRRQMSRRG